MSLNKEINLLPSIEIMAKKLCIISDWSGVHSKDMHVCYEANKYVMEQLGKQMISYEEWLVTLNIFPRNTDFFRAYGVSEEEADDKTLKKLYAEGLKKAKERGVLPVLREGSKEFLMRIYEEGMPFAIVSQHPTEGLIEEAERYGIAELLPDERYILAGRGNKVEPLTRATRILGGNGRDTYYIGDMTFDVLAAKEAGIGAIAITGGYHSREKLKEAEPDIIVDSFSELEKHLFS
jgi:phosphoglycolate phosphatase-like HAD superfamily hydrolase